MLQKNWVDDNRIISLIYDEKFVQKASADRNEKKFLFELSWHRIINIFMYFLFSFYEDYF